MSKQSKRLRSARLIVLTVMVALAVPAWSTISQNPLTLLTSADPNILINMSVETPMGGAAYNDQPDTSVTPNCGGRVDDGGTVGVCYSPTRRYLGYFDPEKCYTYNSGGGYFEPSSAAGDDYSCSAKFSGNFMNWATMTAFDMFTLTMTGGNRVTDSTTATVIERTKKQNNDSWFPHKLVKASRNVAPSTVTPWSDSAIYIENRDWTVEFGTSRGGTQKGTYNVRVKVCDATAGLESNCVKYGSSPSFYYKPEGLMQANADNKRFAVTSYVGNTRRTDGGVLRAKMKYIGPTMPDGNGNMVTNPNAEYGADGRFTSDPDGQSGSGGVVDSGVMNYINKFSRQHGYKGLDPASELFYESLRYFRGQNVDGVTSGPTTDYLAQSDSERGGFPAYTTWDDPIQYSCQKNFIIGINDANPWLDKKLPGTHFTGETFSSYNLSKSQSGLTHNDYGEPSNPDAFFDVAEWTDKVGDDEGLTNTSQCVGCVAGNCNMSATDKTIPGLGQVFGTCPYPPKENSYYIAGLAYQANTTDLRPDMAGKQTVSTFMIDTQEYSTNPLVGQMNMLWLAGKYGGFIDEDGNDEPNLASEWDADGDNEPDNYVLATEPTKIVTGLSRAFFDIDKRTSSSSTVATNSTRTSISSKVFQARFSAADWHGELVSRDFANGAVSDAELSTTIPIASQRIIRTYNPDSRVGIDFAWSSLTADQKTALNTSADGTPDPEGAPLGSSRLNYLRGDQSNEPAFRERPNGVLGDIVNSDPWYAGPVRFGYEALPGVEGTSYFTYRTSSAYLNRTTMVYIGANDGMLHGVNAVSMAEEFAYVPATLFPKLTKLTDPNYAHEFFVDGAPRTGDAYFATPSEALSDTDPSWRTVLAGTTGAGGRAVFALDVSDPGNFATNDVLWEFSSADDADLGHTISQPTIARMANGRWAVIVANGYENDGSYQSALFILFLDADVSDGWDINVDYVKILTGAGSSMAPNGLATPIAVDTDLDRVTDFIFAGDLQGKMWKFDVTDTSVVDTDTDTVNWGVAFSGSPLYTALDSGGTPQPITAKPQVGRHPYGGLIVLFGTGKYFEEGDNVVGDYPQMQTFYGIRDDLLNTVSSIDTLQPQTIDIEGEVNGFEARATSNNPVDWSTQDGWYMHLDSPSTQGGEGERVVAAPLLLNGRIIFVTLVPLPDPCEAGGTSWLMEMDAVTGARLGDAVFDLDDDGSFADEVIENVDGDDIPISGRRSTVGITKQPAIVYEQPGRENKVFSGSTGEIESVVERPGVEVGRQSWRQLR